jgi:hypothetical protein
MRIVLAGFRERMVPLLLSDASLHLIENRNALITVVPANSRKVLLKQKNCACFFPSTLSNMWIQAGLQPHLF